MKKKLGLINVLLAALFVWGCLVLRGQYERARQRYEIFDVSAGTGEPPVMPAPAEAPDVRAATYAAISQRLLLSRDRNPVIEVIVPDEPETERPQPPLLGGVVDLGDGPLALMAPDADTPPRWTGVGEKVGEYTLQAFAEDTLTLSWNGESIELPQSELAAVKFARRERETASRRTAGVGSANRKTAASRSGESASNLAASSEAIEKGKYVIGKQLSSGGYAADPNDGAQDGVEYKGYVRRVRKTPFGAQHWWEKKKQ